MKGLIKKFTNKKIIDFNKVVKIGVDFYLVDDALRSVCNGIKRNAEYVGIYLGSKKKPGLFLLNQIAGNSNKKIWLNKKGSWLFICGRDIMGPSVLKKTAPVKVGDFVLVLNQHDECLGYGRVVKSLASSKVVVTNLFDIGDFLRRER